VSNQSDRFRVIGMLLFLSSRVGNGPVALRALSSMHTEISMGSVALKGCALACMFVAIAFAQSVSLPPMDHLKVSETLRAAKLSLSEIMQICEQLETTSFDVPDSWETELRGRRVSLGNEEGLVIQGTELLCGGTANCQTWVLRRSNGKWLTMFKDQAPIASAFGFQPEAHAGHKNFLIAANSSADAENYIIYHFDGQFYRQARCYLVRKAQQAERVPCK